MDLEDEDEDEGDGDESRLMESRKGNMTQEELWARLDELEKLEELQDERDRCRNTLRVSDDVQVPITGRRLKLVSLFRLSDIADVNGEDTSSSSSSEEEKEGDTSPPVNGLGLKPSWTSVPHSKPPQSGDLKEDDEDGNGLPTIYFSHTVEPKKVGGMKNLEHGAVLTPRLLHLTCVCLFQVRINTGRNTMLKFSERKEQKEHSKRKKKNGHSNGHGHHELHRITTPADIYR